jgi:putative MATE family efflux protein
MLGVNGANVLMTWLLVNGIGGLPTLGVTGAAIGTAVSRSGGGLVIVWLLWRGRSGLKLDFRLRPDMDIIRRLVRIGLPTAGEMLVFHSALLVFTRYVTSLGTAAYAAHITIINIESLSFLPGLGYAVAAGAMVGQSLGARAPDLAERYAYESLRQGMLLMALVGVVIFVWPHLLLGLFVKDPAVVAVGTDALKAAGMVQPVLAINFILNGALRGAGDTRWPLLSRVISTWGLRIPLTIVLVGWLDMGLNAIWLAMCMDFAMQALLASWRFQSGRWQHVQV